MKRVPWVLLVMVGLTGAAFAQASPEELMIQGRIEQWTFWMMVTGAASALFAFLGFAGVMLTLREQRRLTHAQEAAWLHVLGVSVTKARFDSYRWSAEVEIENTGRTPARDIRVAVEWSPDTWELQAKARKSQHSWSNTHLDQVKAGERVKLTVDVSRNADHLNGRALQRGMAQELAEIESGTRSIWWCQTWITFKDTFGVERNFFDRHIVTAMPNGGARPFTAPALSEGFLQRILKATSIGKLSQ